MRISDWSSDVCSSDLRVVSRETPCFQDINSGKPLFCSVAALAAALFHVAQQGRERRRRHPGDACRLAERAGLMLLQLGADLVGQPADGGIIEVLGQGQALVLAEGEDIGLLARSAERRVGKGWGRQCSSGLSREI